MSRSARDRGAALPIVLVATVVFTMLVSGIAGLVAAGLRYSTIVEDRADRLAAADGGLRYGVERLRNMEDLCTTRAGTGGGFTTIFPPQINGADTAVTCRRVGNDIADIQGWGAVITGANVPSGQDMFIVKGAGGCSGSCVKKFRGPVYVADPFDGIDFQAHLIIEDGDLWHYHPDCDTAPAIEELGDELTFEPSFLRGPSCAEQTWDEFFGTPSANVPTPQALSSPAAFDDISFPGCRVFAPGKYVGPITLTGDNYFRSGDYYFEHVPLVLSNNNVIFGFPSGSGDTPEIVPSSACQDAMDYDQTTSGERGGATLWLGGTSKIEIGNQGEFEIFRRQQTEAYVSIYVLQLNGAGFIPSDHAFGAAPSIDWIFKTASGNTNDAAVHGLFWAPYSKAQLGNVTNAAVGQIIGGLAIAQLDVQASASANSFAIGVEGTPTETHFMLESTATKEGESTTIRAIVQYRPDSRQLAVNSWRVVD